MIVNPMIYNQNGGSSTPKINYFQGLNLIYDILLNENIGFAFRDTRNINVFSPFSENPNLSFEIHCKVPTGALSSDQYGVLFETGPNDNNVRHIAITTVSDGVGNNADFGLCAWGTTATTAYLPVDNLKFDEWYTLTFILDTSVNSIVCYVNGSLAGTITGFTGASFTGSALTIKINTGFNPSYIKNIICTRARLFQSQLSVAQMLNNYALDLQSL